MSKSLTIKLTRQTEDGQKTRENIYTDKETAAYKMAARFRVYTLTLPLTLV